MMPKQTWIIKKKTWFVFRCYCESNKIVMAETYRLIIEWNHLIITTLYPIRGGSIPNRSKSNAQLSLVPYTSIHRAFIPFIPSQQTRFETLLFLPKEMVKISCNKNGSLRPPPRDKIIHSVPWKIVQWHETVRFFNFFFIYCFHSSFIDTIMIQEKITFNASMIVSFFVKRMEKRIISCGFVDCYTIVSVRVWCMYD